MLDEGKHEAALYVLEDVAGRINEEPEAYAQVNTLRYLGELYALAEKDELARRYFSDALQRALEITPLWKRFSAVVGVLELHAESFADTASLQTLINTTLEKQLLSTVARDVGVKEIGRYIASWDHAATATQIITLLKELREIKQAHLRLRVLMALTKIEFITEDVVYHHEAPALPYEAGGMEKFLWQIVRLKMLAGSGKSAVQEEAFQSAKRYAEELSGADHQRARKMLRQFRTP